VRCHSLVLLGCIALALVTDVARAQTAPTESPTLQALLLEVRQLRQALQAATIVGQRMQVTVSRMQLQVTAVARAAQRLDEARSKLAEAERWRKRAAAQLERFESLQRQTQDERDRVNRELDLRSAKGELEARTAEEQELRNIESDAQAHVQAEQAKLTEIQDTLDRLDKSLEGER